MANQRILVVEDDNVVSHHLKLCLKVMGHSVIDVCSYGEDAVEKARELKPDLILMDIMLRGAMSGLEAMQIIRIHDDIPVVYLTACEADHLIRSENVPDTFDYLLKPFRDTELKNVIEIALYRHRMEKALRERELSYQNLVESLQGIVCRVFPDDKSKTLYFNDMLEKRTGYKENELPFSRIETLIIQEDKPAVKAAVTRAVAEGKPFEIEYRIRHRDGGIRNFLERGRAIPAKNGNKPFIDSLIIDITERKSAEEQLKQAYLKLMERQAFIESILSNIQSGIIVTDLDFIVKLMNPSAECFFEVSAGAVIGKNIEVVCPSFAEALKNGGQLDEIHCSVCAREHIIGFKMFDMKGKDGSVNGHIISFADLTEIVKIRKEMKLKERLANLGEFVARVAHEIRNPLFGMTAICQIFSMELKLNDDHKKLMDTMMKEALRLKQNVEELLDCSREIKIIKRKCDLVKIINDTLFENSLFINEKQIVVEKDIPDDDFSIEADHDKVKQVLINLVKNAFEASSNNGKIKIIVQRETENIKIYINDTGPGIPDNLLDKIFDIFYTTKRHGTGLGLAISKNIAVAHGGSLLARNCAEGGATFVFTLPVS